MFKREAQTVGMSLRYIASADYQRSGNGSAVYLCSDIRSQGAKFIPPSDRSAGKLEPLRVDCFFAYTHGGFPVRSGLQARKRRAGFRFLREGLHHWPACGGRAPLDRSLCLDQLIKGGIHAFQFLE